ACRAGARRRPDLAQPPRRVRDRDADHRAPSRAERRRVRAGEGDAGRGGARDHGRTADEGFRHSGHRAFGGRGMTTTAQAPEAPQAPDVAPTLESLPRRIWDNARTGNLGSAPVLLALGLVVLIFALPRRTSGHRRTSRTSSRRW